MKLFWFRYINNLGQLILAFLFQLITVLFMLLYVLGFNSFLPPPGALDCNFLCIILLFAPELPKKWKQMEGNKHKSHKDLVYGYFIIQYLILWGILGSLQYIICYKKKKMLLTPFQSLAFHSKVLFKGW